MGIPSVGFMSRLDAKVECRWRIAKYPKQARRTVRVWGAPGHFLKFAVAQSDASSSRLFACQPSRGAVRLCGNEPPGIEIACWILRRHPLYVRRTQD